MKLLFTRQNLALVGLLLILLGILVTLSLVQQRQELRKRAEAQGSLTFLHPTRDETITETSTRDVRIKLMYTPDVGGPTAVPTAIPTQGGVTPVPGTFKRVFVTSTTYTGNLGGLSGADAKCQERAQSVSLGGTWKAWLSGGTIETSAAMRLSHAAVPYTLLNGIQIVADWNGLVANPGNPGVQVLNSAINVTETREVLASASQVWTNTEAGGVNHSTNPCNNWTSTTGSGGATGNSSFKTTGWTAAALDVPGFFSIVCTTQARLYCFEQ